MSKSRNSTRRPGASSIAAFVALAIAKHGKCDESDMIGFIQDSFKKEHLIRVGATSYNLKSPECLAARFLSGETITSDDQERLYRRGIVRQLNVFRWHYAKNHRLKPKQATVAFDSDSRCFYLVAKKADSAAINGGSTDG
jgi:hypothetical protein